MTLLLKEILTIRKVILLFVGRVDLHKTEWRVIFPDQVSWMSYAITRKFFSNACICLSLTDLFSW